ncbi:phosphomannomutase [Aestuariibius insulae]|uniref:phosphomannomutase n=1 Tax=Aestuariibius insulae TaxID=2058287 RepID=UPI00345EF49E
MPPKFGTSGLRGLVSDLTDIVIRRYTGAFLAACPTGTGLYVARDLRPSSLSIAQTVIRSARAAGLDVADCGEAATPALALAAGEAVAAAIMVTGSHIPADRNGLKFYTPEGEITKADEAAILAAGPLPQASREGGLTQRDIMIPYGARYSRAFGPEALRGLRIGIYQHSTVQRDLLSDLFAALGAQTVRLGRSETFIPLDTEAVEPEVAAMLARWIVEHDLDAIVSADGDGDRPLLATPEGIVAGDILGPLTAHALGAKIVVTPVSSNTMAARSGRFEQVIQTRIGSPHVIAGMTDHPGRTVGYEANGGFLLGFEAEGHAGSLSPLLTRDAVLPLIAPLWQARRANRSLSDLCGDWPDRHTASGRLPQVSDRGLAHIAEQIEKAPHRIHPTLADIAEIDRTDGFRASLPDGRILHLRPSGNAPEFRCYVEADRAEEAERLRDETLDALARLAED